MLEKVNPKKKLGQNFLINKFTINKISEIINISADDLITGMPLTVTNTFLPLDHETLLELAQYHLL